jgi:hypothetical protein
MCKNILFDRHKHVFVIVFMIVFIVVFFVIKMNDASAYFGYQGWFGI